MDQEKDRTFSAGVLGGGNWFFSHLGHESGPVTFLALRQAAERGDLSTDDEIWRSGEETHRLAGSILGLFPSQTYLKQPDQAKGGADQSDRESNPYSPPSAPTILDGPPGGLYLPYLRKSSFLLILGLFLAGAGAFFLATRQVQDLERTLCYAIALVLWSCWGLFSMVYLYRAWDMLRIFGAHLSGHKAMLWMLVPFFNGVWSFVALGGWARCWNRSLRTHPGMSKARRVFTPVFYLFSIALLAIQIWGLVFWLEVLPLHEQHNQFVQSGLMIGGGLVFFGLLSWLQLCQSINFLARKKS